MHAFLLIGNSISDQELKEKSQELKAKLWEFPLKKIEDVRELNRLIRLHFSEPTLIVCRNIHEATEETLNAFLKNLEEPQENIFFLLTAASIKKVLPTIVSRCQVIKSLITDHRSPATSHLLKFLNLSADEKLTFIDQIKDRQTAIKFVEDLIFFERERGNYQNMENYLLTYRNLKANGNINLQLSNMVANLVTSSLPQ